MTRATKAGRYSQLTDFHRSHFTAPSAGEQNFRVSTCLFADGTDEQYVYSLIASLNRLVFP